jgi:hypothetical protein
MRLQSQTAEQWMQKIDTTLKIDHLEKDYPRITAGFACLDDFLLSTKEGNYVGPPPHRVFLNFLFMFMLINLVSLGVDTAICYVTIWNLNVADFLNNFRFIFTLFGFLVILKFLPMAQYHSLEHKVANLIDDKREINYENVKSVTGYSKYCGSNLVGIFVCYLFLIPVFKMIGLSTICSSIFSLIIVVFTRIDKKVGKWLQEIFALRTPTDKQISFAVDKGKQLVKNYQKNEKITHLKLKIFTVSAMAFISSAGYSFLLERLLGG